MSAVAQLCIELLRPWLRLTDEDPSSEGADGPDAEPLVLGTPWGDVLRKLRLVRESGGGRASGGCCGEVGETLFLSAGVVDVEKPANG